MATGDERPQPFTRPARRRLVRPLTALVVTAVALLSVAAALLSQRVVNEHEQRLLEQRAAEASSLLSLSGSRVQEAFRALTTVLPLAGVDETVFSGVAAPIIAAGLFDQLAVVRLADGAYTVLSAEGDGLSPGRSLPPAATAALDRAAPDGLFVSTPVFQADGARHLGFAALVPALSPRTLVYGSTVLGPPVSPEPSGTVRALGDLVGALYAGGEPVDDQLILANTPQVPLTGRTVARPLQIGSDPYLLVVKAREPLVGDLARNQPWLLLGGGLTVSLLMGTLVEVLGRRRRYALALVAERTAQLEASLAELDAAQAQLLRQERLAAVGQLAAAVGHELRNPLGVISNVLYLLSARSERDDAWVDRQLRTAEREVNAAVLIVSDLLGFARPREPIFAEVSLPDLLDEVLSVAPAPDGVHVARRVAPGLPAARAVRDLLRQVILNLVTNAYDAMPDGGLLLFEAEAAGDDIRVMVADTGAGMDDETRSQLFEPFFTTKAKGIGLGLAVAQRIVEAHGGTLEAGSRAGTGTSFTITLCAAAVSTAVAR